MAQAEFSALTVPFTDGELLLAYRMVMPDSAAHQALRDHHEAGDADTTMSRGMLAYSSRQTYS